jgi:ATP-binding protein involved in chromosome partitioning
LRHIFNAQFAFVAYERELQAVLVGSAKLVNARSFATLRIYPAGTLKCNRVARDGVGSPRVALALMLKVDVERAIRLDHPNGAERVRPVSNKRSLSRLRIRGAGIQQHEPQADENNSTKRELYFHAAILSAGFSSFSIHRKRSPINSPSFTRFAASVVWLVQVSEEHIREALKSVRYPGFSRDIVSFGLVKSINIDNGNVKVQLALATSDPNVPATIKNDAERALRGVAGVQSAKVLIDIHAPPAGAGAAVGTTRIPGIEHVIAVASGKGGVGKSTVAANLAMALEQSEARIGLCDCDIYGPSISLMFGTRERPMATEDNKIVPIEQYNLKLMSMGFLLDDTSPAILRGPMVTRYTQQFLRQVEWGELDYLVLDLPPGTGDIQLTIVQTVALSGAIIVTTPQEVALIDARKAATMFDKVNVPVLGLIENMSYFICPGDGKRYDIFGSGGGEREAKRLRVPLLGQIPLDIATRESGDRGMPVVGEDRQSAVAQEFLKIAGRIRDAVV